MFGISISELILILLVALVVLGPDKLPKVARSLAKLFGEFRKHSEDLRLNIMGSVNDIGVKQTDFNKKSVFKLPSAIEIVSRQKNLDVEQTETLLKDKINDDKESESHG